MTMTPKPSIVLFAHGSRDPEWHKPMEAVANQIRAMDPQTLVCCAYLELSTPKLDAAVQTLLDQGASTIRIVPVLLGVGKHAREDLPLLVQALKVQHPHITIQLQSAVGENTKLIELLAKIALDAPDQ